MVPYTGRAMYLLVLIYRSYQGLSTYDVIDDSVCVTKLTNLSLQQYVALSKHLCEKEHEADCVHCSPIIQAAEIVVGEQIRLLSNVFKHVLPGITYNSRNAKCRLLQMPVVAIPVRNPGGGQANVYTIEHYPGMSYLNICHILEMSMSMPFPSMCISKDDLQRIVQLAQSNQERETVKYAIYMYKTSGLTPTAARRELG